MITGTPGVGKTTISKIIAKRMQGIHIDCGKVAINNGMIKKYDKKNMTYTIDERSLSKKLKEIIIQNDSIVLDGHFIPKISGFTPELVFVLRCHPRKLIDRLEKKKYSKRKIAENVASELLDFCLKDAILLFGKNKTFEIDNSINLPNQTASIVLRILESNLPPKSRYIDWISKLEKEDSLQKILKYIED